MFDIGPEKLLILLGLALVILGPKKLPEMAKSMGKGFRDFRKAQSDVREEIMGHLSEANGSEPAPEMETKSRDEGHDRNEKG